MSITTPRVQYVEGQKSLNVPTTSETVIAVLPSVSVDDAQSAVALFGFVNITLGASTAGLHVYIHRGSDAGAPVVGTSEYMNVSGGTNFAASIQVVDTPGEVAAQPYALSVAQYSATGDGTVIQSSLVAFY